MVALKPCLQYIYFLLLGGLSLFAQEKPFSFAQNSWHTGITLNILSEDEDDIEGLLFNIDERENTGFAINILGGYFFKENLSVGIQYNYTKKEKDLYYFNNDNASHYQLASTKHTITPFLRNYIPISNDNRFSLFNETDLGFGFGNTLVRHTKSETDITKTYTEEFDFKLGIRPGVNVIIVKGFAFEVAIDLLGLRYTSKNVLKNGINNGTQNNFKFDFDISLLSLDFGLAYYF